MRIASLFAGAVLLGGCQPRDARSQTACLRYEPVKVELTGNLKLETRPGPPNYGESPTDQRLTVPVLDLATPVSTCADSTSATNSDGYSGLRQIQIILPLGDSAYRSLTNRSVTAVGTLSEAQSGHHVTKVVLNAERVTAAK